MFGISLLPKAIYKKSFLEVFIVEHANDSLGGELMTSDFQRPIPIDFSSLCPNKAHHIPGSGEEGNGRKEM